jgi:type 1 fimbriae regulatory protein FimB
LRAIKRHLATRTDALPWLFISELGQPLTRQAVNYLIAAVAERAGLLGVHPHTLRQAHRPLHPHGRPALRGLWR